MADGHAPDRLVLASRRGRMALAAAVAGSSVAMITSTVVNVALPELAMALDASTVGIQWVVNAYALTLAALVLLGGSLGDRYGRRRVFVLGTALFGLSSLGAAAAPDLAWLLVARGVMGLGAALLTPGSLALLEASFAEEDRAAAIGAWSGLGGVAAAVGPLLGGALLDVGGWRPLFLLNLPVALAAVLLARAAVPESHDEATHGTRLDVRGAVAGVLGLGLVTFGLIRLGGAGDAVAILAALLGVGVLGVFVVLERRSAAPLLPPELFGDRVFTVANLLTFVVYAAIGGVFLLLTVALRLLLGFSGLAAGAGTLPVTLLMLLLAARSGRIAAERGPRAQLVGGPLLLAVGAAWLALLDTGGSYWTDVLPPLVVFGIGLVAMVAPVTATVLAAAPATRAGTASGVNNAVARTASLLAVAVLPVAAGLGPTAFEDPQAYADGYATAMLLAAGLAAAGALTAWLGLPSGRIDAVRDAPDRTADEPVPTHHHPHGDITCPVPAAT